MEISQGIVTAIEVRTSSEYVAGKGTVANSSSTLELDNGFTGWLRGGDNVPIAEGDKVAVLTKVYNSNKQIGPRGHKIQAFHNTTQNIQSPNKKAVWTYRGATGLSWISSIICFNLGSSGLFFCFLTLSIFLTFQSYKKTRLFNQLKRYLRKDSDL